MTSKTLIVKEPAVSPRTPPSRGENLVVSGYIRPSEPEAGKCLKYISISFV